MEQQPVTDQPTRGIRIECRKCGAILPGPVEICPICYANQSHEEDSRKGEYKPFLLIGFLVAAANGVVERSELQALSQILGPSVPASQIEGMLQVSVEQVEEAVQGLSKELNHLIAPTQKLRILRDMVVISYADGEVDDCEMKCLYWLCDNLDINPTFVDHVIESAQRGVD